MAAKYSYYVLGSSYVDDVAYDLSERDWFKLGRELGLLTEEETSPCIDFNYTHELAKDAELLAIYLIKPSNRCIYEILLHKYKQFPEYWVSK